MLAMAPAQDKNPVLPQGAQGQTHGTNACSSLHCPCHWITSAENYVLTCCTVGQGFAPCRCELLVMTQQVSSIPHAERKDK